MRSAANSHVKMAMVSRRVPDTSARGSRSYHAETKSKPARLHRHGTREKLGISIINTPIFNSSARTGWTEQTYGETGWGHRPYWDYLPKNRFSCSSTYKNRQAIWSTFWRWTAKIFKPRLPETVWKRFQQKIGTFIFKSQNDGPANIMWLVILLTFFLILQHRDNFTFSWHYSEFHG